jgi:hypothetical protein
VFGLPPHRRFPGQAEPFEVFKYRSLEFRPAPRRVDVLDAEQKSSTARARQLEIQQRRKSVAEMEVAIGAWRKSEHR